MICHICTEAIAPGDVQRNGVNFVAHQECMLREVAGGIGHHIDHEHYCQGQHDPDAGLSKRLSAVLVWAWYQHVGTDSSTPG